MGSYFEEFIVRNTMVQSDFNWNTWFRSYEMFLVEKVWDVLTSAACVPHLVHVALPSGIPSVWLVQCAWLRGEGSEHRWPNKKPKSAHSCGSVHNTKIKLGWSAGGCLPPGSVPRSSRLFFYRSFFL